MSFFFGGKGQKVKPQYTGLQLQTSSSTMPLTVLWGMNRIAPNIFWYDNFKAVKQKQKAGKGLGGAATTYTYSASIMLGLCQGQIDSVKRAFKDQEKTTDYTTLGFSLFVGTKSQAAWGYLTTSYPAAALTYSGVAYLAAANYPLGASATTPQHSFEVAGLRYNTGPAADDADAALVIQDILTDADLGVGFSSVRLDSTQLLSTGAATTTGDGSFQTYCRALGIGINPALSSQEVTSSILDRWANLTNSAIVWTGYSLKFIPYGLDTLTANGVTYLPNLVIAYSLSDADYITSPGTAPIEVSRKDPADCYNSLKLEVNNRANEYNTAPVEWKDQALIDLYGLRQDNTVTATEICSLTMGGLIVNLIGQRKAYTRNSYEFTLSSAYILLEPMDILSAYDPVLGSTSLWIQDIEENDDGTLKITADAIPVGLTGTPTVPTQTLSNTVIDAGVSPGPVNAPIIFEPGPSYSNGAPEIWAVVSGGNGTSFNPNWGGCFVYVSTDNVTFQQIGRVDSAARQGKLTASLATYASANPDTGHTLSVDLSMSGGDLQSVSSTDAAREATACYVDGEVISFQNAALTGAYTYDLTTLYRGLAQSTIGAHASATRFARLDENIFKYATPAAFIGQLLYFKFQSFNLLDNAVEDLSTCSVYTYTPTGVGRSITPPSAVGLSFASRTQGDGTTIIRGNVVIGPSSGYLLDHYDVQVSSNPGAGTPTWQDISAISAGGTLTYFEPAIASTNYQVRARAASSGVGNIPSAWVYSAIVSSGTISGSASETITTDANFTATVGVDQPLIFHTGTLTADRTGTLSTTGAVNGSYFKVVRTGGGAFNLTVAGRALVTNTFAEFTYDGSTWQVTSYGSL